MLERQARRRVAILVDVAFQTVKLGKAGVYVKSLLNLIENPPRSYEGIVPVVATSDGVTRWGGGGVGGVAGGLKVFKWDG